MGVALLEFLDLLGIVLFLLFFGTQLILPVVKGKPLFPLFRRDSKTESEKRLEAAQRRVEEAKALKEAAETELAAAKLEVEASRLRDEATNTHAEEASVLFNTTKDGNQKKDETQNG